MYYPKDNTDLVKGDQPLMLSTRRYNKFDKIINRLHKANISKYIHCPYNRKLFIRAKTNNNQRYI